MHVNKWKKPVWKSYVLCNSNYKTAWRKQIIETISKSVVFKDSEGAGDWIGEAQRTIFQGGRTILCDTVMANTRQ